MLASSNNVSELIPCGACLEHAHLSHDPSPLAHHPSSPHSDSSCISPQSSSCGEIDDFAKNFDCNICMQTCQEPVTTMCGHLFCWPCLYHHYCLSLHPASSFKACPVCKQDVQDKIVPLYGCGRIGFVAEKLRAVHIPRRPAAIVHSASRQGEPHPRHAGGFLARGTAAALLRRRRFNNEEEFVLHWVFIMVASATIVFFLAC